MNNIYNLSYQFLINHLPDDFNKKMLEKYFTVDKCNYKNLNDIFERLVISAQNYQSMPNVIGYASGKNKDSIKSIICDLDFRKILEKYTINTLYEAFKKKFDFKISDKSTETHNSWYKFSRSIMTAAEFLNQFKDIYDFRKFVESYSYNDLTKASLPMLMEHEIYGFGFALCCDFLKEIGYYDYCKPDIHLIDVFSETALCEKNQYDVFKFLIKTAREENYTPYKLDKIIWLICSGNYYKDDVTAESYKKEFIEFLKKQL